MKFITGLLFYAVVAVATLAVIFVVVFIVTLLRQTNKNKVDVKPVNMAEVKAKSPIAPKDRDWFPYSSPEEEYMSLDNGDKEKSLFNHGDGYGDLATRERRDVEAPEPCGFYFKNVIISDHASVDLETGEMGDGNPFITPDINNFAKMANDWKELDRFLEWAGSQAPQFPMNKVLFYLNNLRYLPSRKTEIVPNNPLRDHDYSSYIVVEPLTKTGKVKKFPIRTSIDIRWTELFDDWQGKKSQPERENVTFLSYYLKDGNIGKGEINIWVNDVAYILEFALDTKNNEYYIKKIRTNEGMSMGEWKVIYPFG